MTIPKLMIIIPAYNEEEMLNKSLGEIDEVLTTLIKHGEVASSSKLLLIMQLRMSILQESILVETLDIKMPL